MQKKVNLLKYYLSQKDKKLEEKTTTGLSVRILFYILRIS